MNMTREVKDKWVAALRSGKYVQGRHALRKGGIGSDGAKCYCCLGVLAEINDLLEVDECGEDVIKGTGHGGFLQDAEDNVLFLPMDWQKKLALLNDDMNSFHFIADYIESEIRV